MGGEFFNTYFRNDFQLQAAPLNVAAANGQRMKARGQFEIDITIGKLASKACFLVVEELGMEVLIGNDQLKAWNTRIDFDEERAEVGPGNYVPIRIRRESEEKRVTVKKGTLLKPRSRSQVTLVSEPGMKNKIRLVYTKPDKRYRGMVHIHEGIVDHNDKIQVWVVNEAPYPIMLKKGLPIGHIRTDDELTQQMEDVEIIRKIVIETLKEEEIKQREEIKQPEPLPADPEIIKQIDGIDLSIDTDLTKDQQAILRTFLKKYANIFASNPKSPGVTHGVTHSINTGDNLPIKQYPRRVSPAIEERIRTEVREMAKNKIRLSEAEQDHEERCLPTT